MSNNSTEAVFSGEWAAEKRLVADRLAAMVSTSGQSGRPGLSFEEKKTRMGVLPDGDQVSGVMVYHPAEDLVAVDLKRLFEAPGTRVLSSAWTIAMIDGFLLHELGHRRDRVAVGAACYGWALGGVVAVIGCLASFLHRRGRRPGGHRSRSVPADPAMASARRSGPTAPGAPGR